MRLHSAKLVLIHRIVVVMVFMLTAKISSVNSAHASGETAILEWPGSGGYIMLTDKPKSSDAPARITREDIYLNAGKYFWGQAVTSIVISHESFKHIDLDAGHYRWGCQITPKDRSYSTWCYLTPLSGGDVAYLGPFEFTVSPRETAFHWLSYLEPPP